jgi:hypothetical protein
VVLYESVPVFHEYIRPVAVDGLIHVPISE